MKAYLYGAGVLVIIGLLLGVFYLGGQHERLKRAQAEADFRARETVLLDEINKKKSEREVVYRDKIKVVEKVVDACLDTTMPDAVRLQLSGGDKAK